MIYSSVKLGTTTIGIQTAEGVILAAEKRMASTLMEPESVEKIIELDGHLAGAMSGFVADARTMIDFARVEAQVGVLSQKKKYHPVAALLIESCLQRIIGSTIMNELKHPA